MIPQIKEINFPEYATLSTATASLVDMGDKTISAQVKIDGAIAPDFSYNWEIEFQGERYIQPLRKPQVSKSNESISSTIDLTFYHRGIYDLKRYFFVSTVELDAGTLMADNYVVPLRLNIAEFVTYLNNVLKYYYGETYKVFLDPDYEYDETDRKDVDINYTKIWDVITKIYELFGVRWVWDTHSDNREYYSIKIGYPSVDVSHIFEYGFDGGLLKFERQVQNAEIANVVFGRGSSDNIPYRYFKNKSEDNPTFPADPDWIPELENIHFANLRGKTFRDYVQGWKTNPNRNTLDGTLPIEELDLIKWIENEAYRKGHEDATFNPIEYVKDDESIAKYGEIYKGLEDNEEIKPTIQGVTIDGMGRVDQIVDVEPIFVDESTENADADSKVVDIDDSIRELDITSQRDEYTLQIKSKVYAIPNDYKGNFIKDVKVEAFEDVKGVYIDLVNPQYGKHLDFPNHPLKAEIVDFKVLDAITNNEITQFIGINGGATFFVLATIKLTEFIRDVVYEFDPYTGQYIQAQIMDKYCSVFANLSWQLDYTPVHGQILGNYEDGATRKSQTLTIPAKGKDRVVFTTEQFTISEKNAPATSVEMPYRITSSLKGGEYDPRPNVVAINVETGEQMTSLNLPAGTYYLQNSIQIDNFASQRQTFKVELLPTYIYYSYDSASWKPTFDIWVKNIWQTMPNKLEEDYTYEHRIWDAILGNHLGNEAKVVFSSGSLSGHSDWEFLIADTPKRDTSKIIDGVPSEWRITLYKSDAEMEATDKWLPSIMTQASAGDHIYFVGIEMPHQYVLWAEERLDKYKREELDKVSDVDSTIVVQLDKVRLNQLQIGESRPLLNSLRVGNNIKVADSRFIQSTHETLHLQSITYTWDASTTMLPNVEVVLSDEIATYSNPFEDINRKIDDAEDRIKDVRKTSLAQIDKAKKSIRNTSLKINALSVGNANIPNQVNTLIGSDTGKSVRVIAEDVANPIDERVSTLIGSDAYKSVRTIANEVLAGASTGGEIDLGLYLSKSEAEVTYEKKGASYTKNEVYTKKEVDDNIITSLVQKADKSAVEKLSSAVSAISTSVGNKAEKTDVEALASVVQDKANTSYVNNFFVRKEEAIDFAKDLTGVLEATPEEFTFRPSAGDKSIRDESAVIRRIKGNTSVWGQLADISASFVNDGNRYIITRNDDGSVTIKRDPLITSGYWCAYNMNRAYRNTSHKYMFYADVTVRGVASSADYCDMRVYNLASATDNRADFRTNGRHTFCCFGTPDSSTSWQFAFYVYGVAELSIHNLQCFDLTAIYGAGNEPTTLEEFREVYPDDYYPYCEPEIRNMRATAIGTVGFNLYNGNYAKLIGGKTYYIGGTDIGTLTFTPNSKTASEVIELGDDRMYTPINSGKLSSTGTDLCVHFQHSGIKDGDCADYVEHILELPEIAKYFPDGMNSVGEVYDEINSENAIKRCSIRRYAEGDENNADVRTDKTNTVYILGKPIISPILEPMQLAYNVEDFGTEQAISNQPSSPFRADIVYQFNAEGRIRDNGRNIERLESIVAPLKNVPSSAHLATQDFVLAHIPTHVATATERRKVSDGEALLALSPNIMYDWTVGGSLENSITIPSLYIDPETIGTYDHKWMVRVACMTSDNVIIPFDVLWKDGIAPNWTSWCICEITFKCDAQQDEAFRKIIGEWKIYR